MSRPECGTLMADAAREWGLFQVVNHGVPAAAVSELQRVGRAFFALPREEKERHCTGSFGSIEGYGVGITTRRNLEGKKNWEDYLFHYVAPPAIVNHDIWPKNPAGYREANEEYCRHIQRLRRELFEHLSLGLGLEMDAMSEAFGGDNLVLLQKINYYPACPQRRSPSESARTPTCAWSPSCCPTTSRGSRSSRTAAGTTSRTCARHSSSSWAIRSRQASVLSPHACQFVI
jgi:flavonol synthase